MGRPVICTTCKTQRFPREEELTIGILFSAPRPCAMGCGRTVTATTGYHVMRVSVLGLDRVPLETR